jgi:hypothetical protein
MARQKGAKSLTPEAKAFVQRVERMLRKADPNMGNLELLACRLMTHPAHLAMETKFFAHEGQVTDQREVINWAARLKAAEIAANVWRTLMQYKHGMPTQAVEHTGTVDLAVTIREARERAMKELPEAIDVDGEVIN